MTELDNRPIQKTGVGEKTMFLYFIYVSFIYSLYEHIPTVSIVNFVVHWVPFIVFVLDKKKSLKRISIPVCIILLGLFSYVVSDDISVSSFFNSFRWSCLTLFVYLWGVSRQWDENKQRTWIAFLFKLGVLQIVVGIIKFLLFSKYGEMGYEMPLGLLGHSVTSLVVPTALCFIFAYYLEHRKYPRYYYLLLSLGFFFCGIIGGKRVLVIILPAVLFVQPLIYLWFSDKKTLLFKYLILFLLISPCVIYFFARITPTLNPERSIGGSFDPVYLYEYIEQHATTEQENQYGYAVGRSSALSIYIDQQFSDWKTLLFGKGLGYFAHKAQDRSANEALGISYGMNTYIWTSHQWGITGAILWFFMFFQFFITAFYILKREKDTFWRAYSLGMMGAALLAGPFQFYYCCDLRHMGYTSFYYMLGAILQQKALHIHNKSKL